MLGLDYKKHFSSHMIRKQRKTDLSLLGVESGIFFHHFHYYHFFQLFPGTSEKKNHCELTSDSGFFDSVKPLYFMNSSWN